LAELLAARATNPPGGTGSTPIVRDPCDTEIPAATRDRS
jgi:hypothetical protein